MQRQTNDTKRNRCIDCRSILPVDTALGSVLQTCVQPNIFREKWRISTPVAFAFDVRTMLFGKKVIGLEFSIKENVSEGRTCEIGFSLHCKFSSLSADVRASES